VASTPTPAAGSSGAAQAVVIADGDGEEGGGGDDGGGDDSGDVDQTEEQLEEAEVRVLWKRRDRKEWTEELKKAHAAFERGKKWANCVAQFFEFEAESGYTDAGLLITEEMFEGGEGLDCESEALACDAGCGHPGIAWRERLICGPVVEVVDDTSAGGAGNVWRDADESGDGGLEQDGEIVRAKWFVAGNGNTPMVGGGRGTNGWR
jgi:hypothetical protein